MWNFKKGSFSEQRKTSWIKRNIEDHNSMEMKSNQTCSNLFVLTLQYVSNKYANDLAGFDRTSHACMEQIV